MTESRSLETAAESVATGELGGFPEHEEALQVFETYLSGKWLSDRCGCCGADYFKKPSPSQADNCGGFDCAGGYAFLEAKPPRNNYLGSLQAGRQFQEFFAQHGFKRAEPIPIDGHYGSQIFTGTAGQVFDKPIYHETAYDSHRYYVAQPVIRMQRSDHDGFLRSFVNISVEQLGSTPAEHLDSMEHYLDFLSSAGLYVGDLRLKVFEDRPDWGRGEFRSAVIGFYYDGLEIGVANYLTSIPQASRAPLTMSDVSFGLERVAWAINKNARFVDTIGPPQELARRTPHDVLDAYRTLTLLLGSGVSPDRQSQAGSKLKSLFLQTIPSDQPIRHDLINYYHSWWRNFIPLKSNASEVTRTWETIDMQRLAHRLGVSALKKGAPNDLVEGLLKGGVVKAKQLREEA